MKVVPHDRCDSFSSISMDGDWPDADDAYIPHLISPDAPATPTFVETHHHRRMSSLGSFGSPFEPLATFVKTHRRRMSSLGSFGSPLEPPPTLGSILDPPPNDGSLCVISIEDPRQPPSSVRRSFRSHRDLSNFCKTHHRRISSHSSSTDFEPPANFSSLCIISVQKIEEQPRRQPPSPVRRSSSYRSQRPLGTRDDRGMVRKMCNPLRRCKSERVHRRDSFASLPKIADLGISREDLVDAGIKVPHNIFSR